MDVMGREAISIELFPRLSRLVHLSSYGKPEKRRHHNSLNLNICASISCPSPIHNSPRDTVDCAFPYIISDPGDLNSARHSFSPCVRCHFITRAPSSYQRSFQSSLSSSPEDRGDINEYRKWKVALLTGITGQDRNYLYIHHFPAQFPHSF